MRCLFVFAALLAAGSLYAQFYAANAAGYTSTERGVGTAPPASFLSHGGAAWDPTGPDIYFWDVANGEIRRFDTAALAPAAPALLTVPPGPFGTYVDTMAFDESTDELYIGESGAQVMHKVKRTGPDTIDPAFGTGGIQTSATYTFYLYDLKFDPFGRLMGSAANLFGSPPVSGVYSFSKTTLDATQIINLRTPGGTDISGPIAFDAQGNLFYALPPWAAGEPMRIARWSKTQLDTAINSGGATVLTIADAALVIDWSDNFPNAGSMGFRFEGGKAILYFAATDGMVYRSDLATRAYSIFATAAAPPAGEVPYPSALAVENPNAAFRPFSGDSARLCVIMGARDAGFEQVRHSVCLFGCGPAPAGVLELALSGVPSAVSNGLAFGATVELRDGSSMLLNVNGTVQAELLSGAGTLGGRTTAVAVGGVAIFDDLVLSGSSGSVILRFSLVGGTVSANTAALSVSTDPTLITTSNESNDSSGCAGSGGASWAALPVAALIVALARRRRRMV